MDFLFAFFVLALHSPFNIFIPTSAIFNEQDSPKGSKFGGSGIEMTEEEAVAEQQRMFAEARARMNNGMSLQKQSDSDPSLES